MGSNELNRLIESIKAVHIGIIYSVLFEMVP